MFLFCNLDCLVKNNCFVLDLRLLLQYLLSLTLQICNHILYIIPVTAYQSISPAHRHSSWFPESFHDIMYSRWWDGGNIFSEIVPHFFQQILLQIGELYLSLHREALSLKCSFHISDLLSVSIINFKCSSISFGFVPVTILVFCWPCCNCLEMCCCHQSENEPIFSVKW